MFRGALWVVVLIGCSSMLFGQACVPSATQTCTPNINLALPALNTPLWNVPLNQNFNWLDTLLSGTAGSISPIIPVLKNVYNLDNALNVDGCTGTAVPKYACTPAGIQSAINDAQPGCRPVFIPPTNGTPVAMGGTQITIPSCVKVSGAGMKQTILQWTLAPLGGAVSMTSPSYSYLGNVELSFTSGNTADAIRITGSDAVPAIYNTFENILIDFSTLSGSGASAIHATSSGPSFTDINLNTFRNIIVNTADQIVVCSGCEGNYWQIVAQNSGAHAGTVLFNELAPQADDIIDARIESGSGNFANEVCLQIAGSNNLVRLTCGGNLSGITAVNDTGGWNIFDIDTVGSPTLGTIPSSSQYRYVNSANGGNVLGVSQIKSANLDNIIFVNGPSDVGAQINAAYAALPPNGGTIIIVPKSDNSCYNFTTPIVANSPGKYLLLQGWMAGGTATGCLNYTPTTGSAITLDFVPIGGSRGAVYGIKDLFLTNNSCTSIGGCGGSTTGISVTSTNGGIDGAIMQNVTIQGFTVGYGENARVPSSEVQWTNPRIYNNGVGMNLFGTAEEQILGGTFYGNGNHIQSGDANSQPELHITGTYFIAHSNEAFSFTNTSLGGTIYLTDVHLENGSNSTINAHYVDGNVNIFGKGGVAEDDSTGGTSDWWFNPNGLAFMWDALELVTASRNPSVGVLALSGNTRAKLTGFIINPLTLTSIVGGTNAAKATVCMLSGNITNTASTCAMESPLQLPTLRLQNLLLSNTAPTIASGFGTGATVPTSNGTAVFKVNVGTGGTATGGVITMPAATTDWICDVKNITALAANRANQWTVQTAGTTTSVTIQNQTISTGAALAWNASDIIQLKCGGE